MLKIVALDCTGLCEFMHCKSYLAWNPYLYCFISIERKR